MMSKLKIKKKIMACNFVMACHEKLEFVIP
jgi:hypothetical protein